MSTELLAVRPDRELTNGETELLFHLLPPERRERLLRQHPGGAAAGASLRLRAFASGIKAAAGLADAAAG